MAPNLVLALLLNLDSGVLFVSLSLKLSAVSGSLARRKGHQFGDLCGLYGNRIASKQGKKTEFSWLIILISNRFL